MLICFCKGSFGFAFTPLSRRQATVLPDVAANLQIVAVYCEIMFHIVGNNVVRAAGRWVFVKSLDGKHRNGKSSCYACR